MYTVCCWLILFSRYVLLYVCGLSWRRSMFIGCDLCISWWCAFVIYKLLHVWFMWSPGDRVRSCFFTSYINVWTQSSGVNSWSLVEWELVEVSPSEVSPRLEMTNVFPKSVDVLGLNFGWWMVIDMLVWRLSHRVFLVALIVDDSWWECLEQKWCFQSCMPWAGTIMKNHFFCALSIWMWFLLADPESGSGGSYFRWRNPDISIKNGILG